MHLQTPTKQSIAKASRANRVAQAVLSQFEKLPPKRKPIVRNNGFHEWVPLSGIVAEEDGTLTCLALATGMKCLPAEKLPEARGNGLHDWHAEILVVRALNRLLLEGCRSLAQGAAAAGVVQWAPSDGTCASPFQLRDGVKLHMYCSEAPCGDASMELTMAAQEDASPWEAPMNSRCCNGNGISGRSHFSQLGIVRRKPARGDASPTLSKSCSDKLALKQCTSLLSSLTALFIDPANAYAATLVLPESRYSAVACQRAFSDDGRMGVLAGTTWPGGYAFRPFTVETTTEEFDFSRQLVQARAVNISPSSLAAVWSCSGVDESISGGAMHGRKRFHREGASCTSRRQMWMAASQIAGQLHRHGEILNHLSGQTYQEVKDGPLLAGRRAVKAGVRKTALAGWVASEGDSEFGIDIAA